MIDRYTKAVLTVIAVCLCLITAQNFNIVPAANASIGFPQTVSVCNVSGKGCAFIDSRGNVSTKED